MYNTIIIEDDPMVMDINIGYTKKCANIRVVQTFKNGREALDYINKGNSVDLIILDVFMPEMNGIEFLANLRESGNTCCVIPVTAANERNYVEKIYSYNVVDYLAKPFTEKRFKKAIKKFIDYKEALKKSPVVSQKTLDMIFNPQPSKTEPKPPKIDPFTLVMITDFMKAHKNEFLSVKEIASGVNLSLATVRGYMNHLYDEGHIKIGRNLKTKGKPAVLYRYI